MASAERPLRLFLALELEDTARRQLAGWTAAALADRDDVRPVAADELHVTLVFLGATPRDRAAAIWAAAKAAAEGRRAPAMEPIGLKGVPWRRPRLFALDLADEGGRAAALQAAVAGALQSGGLHHPERRSFWAHMTLARVRRGVRARPLQAAALKARPFSIPSMALYRSHLSSDGARYEVLDRLELRR